jgi:hypothetical protein
MAGIGIKRATFEKVFTSKFGFAFSFGKPSNELPNRIGRANSCTLQLIGPTDNLVNAGLILPLSQSDPSTTARAREYLKTFFGQVPGGESGPAWVEQNVLEATINKEVKITVWDLVVTLGGIATDDGLVMTVMVSR